MADPKLSSKELKKRIVEYYRSMPVMMNESAFATRLDDTVISRYERADALCEEIKSTLKSIASHPALSRNAKAELARSATKLDESVGLLAYGYLGYNKAARGKFRPELWPGDEKLKKRK